jgi:hypothetical protein
MIAPLPREIAAGASLRGQEYGRKIQSFPAALFTAERLGFACLGGSFNLGSMARSLRCTGSMPTQLSPYQRNHGWTTYIVPAVRWQRRSTGLSRKWIFKKVTREWPALEAAVAAGLDPLNALVFVAYFVTWAEFLELSHGIKWLYQNP